MTAEHESSRDDAPARGEGVAATAWSALLQEAPFAVVMYEGPEHRVIFSNRRHDELTMGRMRVGQTLAALLPELVGQPLAQTLDRVYATGTAESVKEAVAELTIEGVARQAWLDVTWQPIRNRAGRVVGVLATAIEVTEHVRARHGLEAARAELGRALEVRDEFLSIASHELRTPLTALQLQLHAAVRWIERAEGVAATGLGHKLEVAVRQTERLAALVGGLLDVSRISLGQLAIEPEAVDLGVPVRAVVERYAASAQAAGSSIALEAEAPVIGQWDRSGVEQAVANLITNAIKYGAGQPIEVRVESDEAWARVVVRDHGVGIPPAGLERIFGRFERAVSSRHYGGLGLGLYIARQIALAHGGDIEVESAPGCGATFTLRLPVQPEPHARGGRPPEA
jgi:signal transduction histidine kinase